MSVSYFEIGGQIIESVLEPEFSWNKANKAERRADNKLLKQAHKASIEAVDELVGDSYNVKKAIRGGQKAKGGAMSVRRGLVIAAALAAADGPLPIGDALAAGFLIGGGAYMMYSGAQDVIQ